MKFASRNIGVQVSELLLSFPLGITSEVELPDHMLVLHFFLGSRRIVIRGTCTIFLYTSPTLSLFQIIAILMGGKWNLVQD